MLKRSAYTLLYNKELRLPLWVSWHLTREHVKTVVANRKGMKFEEDYDVPAPRATNLDYVNSGYDRGHMCPAGDNKWSYEALTESFLYTNCCPQLHSLNGGDWNTLENRCRNWAVKYGDVYIVCGPLLLNKKHKTLGKNKVVVPEAFYKVVLCLGDRPKAIGFIYRNEATKKNITEYVNTVDQVERITKLDFFAFLDDETENEIESNADLYMW
jgi:endonuclease G